LRFAVHGPGNPVASPRSHGVPRRDIPGCIHVSIAGETAGSAPEDGLARARLRIHLPARRAALTRVLRLNSLYSAWSFRLEAAYQQTPSRPKDFTVEPGLGAGELALQATQALALFSGEACYVQQLTRRQRGGYRYTAVDSDNFVIARCRDRVWNGRESDMPASGSVRTGHASSDPAATLPDQATEAGDIWPHKHASG
jgi:hypothetical protein